jgi:hypothetical protein
MRQLLVLVAAASLLGHADAVDRSKFRTCKDAGFCNRHRSKTAEPEVSSAIWQAQVSCFLSTMWNKTASGDARADLFAISIA